MTTSKAPFALCLIVTAVAAVACGSGGGGGGAPGAAQGPGATTTETLDSELLVVRYDQNGDGVEDLVTLDTTTSPYEIVEALHGTSAGGTVDATAALEGQPIDEAISDALSDHVASAIEVGSEIEIDVNDAFGNTVTVTVFE